MKRIVILGFMACGKTTVAKELARRLDCDFIDLDSFITERHGGRSPAEVIQQDGEKNFREIETLALCEVLQSTTARVIALGGGTWAIPANRTLVALHDCVSVWLDVPFAVCWNRIIASESVRPLAPDYDAALTRYEFRRADYALANLRIDFRDSDSVTTLVERIANET